MRIDDGPLVLRPLARRDLEPWREVRLRNEGYLRRWEPTVLGPWAARHTRRDFQLLRRYLDREATQGRSLPLAIVVHGSVVGQVTVANVVRGVHLSGDLGYWVDGALAGRGVVTRAAALLLDHALGTAGMHRVTVHVRPENVASLRVVAKLGLRQECFHPAYLHIDGGWRDHVGFAALAGEFPGGVAARVPRARL